ncbi:hypothetical protein SMICM17S_13050 [Streptomyces microflavus]
MIGRRGVARAVGEEHTVGLNRVHLLQRRGRRQDVHLDATLRHPVRRHPLDTEVDRGDREPLRPDRRNDIRLLRRHLGGEVGAGHLGGLTHPGQQRPLIRDRVPGEDPDPHRTPLPQMPGEGAGVDTTDAHHALRHQLLVQRPPRAPVGRLTRRITDHITRHPDTRRLRILVIHPGVPDMRSRHHHHLPVVRRIGQRLLITGHAGGEHRLTEGLPHSPVSTATKRTAVLQDEYGGLDEYGGRSSAAPARHRSSPQATRAPRSGTHSRRNWAAVLRMAFSTSPLDPPRNRNRAPTCSYPPTRGTTWPTAGTTRV